MGVATGNSTSQKSKSFITDNESVSTTQLASHPEQTSSVLVDDPTQSSDYLAHLARATNDAVRDWDVRSGKLCWRQGLCSLFGYDSQPTTERITFWDERLHPGDQARIKGSIGDAFSSEAQQWSGEYRFRCGDGNYLLILERAFIVRDVHQRPVRFIGSLMDVTARKQLHDQVSRSQKMEAFGQLAGGVAHDFNNFLTSILGYSDLVLDETGGKGTVANHVGEIRKAAGRACALAGQLLAFSRRKVLEPHVVEVNSIITNLERTLLPLLGENISVVCHLHHDKAGAHVKVDAEQLTQIIINLALNARDAMPGGGQLTLETSTVTMTEPEILFGADVLPAGDYVVINLIDNGSGMTEQTKAHLFEPFFTTKDGHSSGLGLATSYGIVCQSGGRIRVESDVGKGTKVQIYLPRVPAPPPPSYRRPSRKLLPSGTESIMVVEDDVSVRHISVRILRNLGYEVIEAASCFDAQRMFEQREKDKKIHLLLTDIVMPQMSGRDFADWIRTVSPATKIVFVSGYLEESRDPHDRGEVGTYFLSKPFDPEQLATAIRQALDS